LVQSKEELHQQWKESGIVPVTGTVRNDCSDCLGIHGAIEVCTSSSSVILWSVWKVFVNTICRCCHLCTKSYQTVFFQG